MNSVRPLQLPDESAFLGTRSLSAANATFSSKIKTAFKDGAASPGEVMSLHASQEAPGSQSGSSISSTSFTSSTSFPSATQNLLTVSPTDPPRVRKLKTAATEFEAMLLAKWWSSMKDSGLGEQDDSTDPGHDTLDAMGIQAMSTAVASRGGLGIGAMLVRSLLSNAEEIAVQEPSTPVLRRSNSAT